MSGDSASQRRTIRSGEYRIPGCNDADADLKRPALKGQRCSLPAPDPRLRQHRLALAYDRPDPWIIESYAKLADGADRFLDGYWRSGDVGVIDKHGYLKITDRLKDVIKSGGEWISSIDMENAISSHPRIREAAVIGVEHPTWQERPVVIAVTDDGTEVPLTEIHALLPAFARWQLPDTVVYVDAIPRTSVGKVDKKALRAAHAGTYRTTA